MSFNRRFLKGIKCLFKTRIPKILSAFILLYFVFSVLFKKRNFDMSTTVNVENEIRDGNVNANTSKDNRHHIVLGILSRQQNGHYRITQRETWIYAMLRLQNVLPFIITYKFLLDKPSSESIKENYLHQDIVYLNVSYHGLADKFGEKMYVWWRYIHKIYPYALMGARIDDDVFVCVPQLFERLDSLKSTTLYYGWRHGKRKQIDRDNRIDDMFLVLGKDLISLISKKTYCGERTCKNKDDLIETGQGGTSMAEWLSVYNDNINFVHFVADNDRIVQLGDNQSDSHNKSLKPNFCDNKLVFHKSTCEIMHQLHVYNDHLNNSRNIEPLF
ncbi:Hypothetical predicted protein [Mytilus galloprovincialis]|uniref:Hexosyltransferase n=2 Tax=Mytilus galloprovincialis TaxID=29158 RepID=A0A8B6H2R7_MYTGA|nr:Hypothetical predicted protein [Mytilus galloprovincialis]